MNRRKYRRYTSAERSAHLSAWSKSGQSAQSYAQQNGIRAGNLYRWSRAAKSVKPVATFLPVNVGASNRMSECEITLRANGLECLIRSDAAAGSKLVSLVQSLKEALFDV